MNVLKFHSCCLRMVLKVSHTIQVHVGVVAELSQSKPKPATRSRAIRCMNRDVILGLADVSIVTTSALNEVSVCGQRPQFDFCFHMNGRITRLVDCQGQGQAMRKTASFGCMCRASSFGSMQGTIAGFATVAH